MSEENSNGYLEGGPSDAKSQKMEVQEDSKASPQLEAEPGAVQIKPGPSDAKSQKMEVQEDSKASPQLEAEPGAVQIEPGGADALTGASGAIVPVENIITGGVFYDANFGPLTHRNQVTNIDHQLVHHHHHYGFESRGRGGSDFSKDDIETINIDDLTPIDDLGLEPSASALMDLVPANTQALDVLGQFGEIAIATAGQPIPTGSVNTEVSGGDFQTANFGPVSQHNELTRIDNQQLTANVYHIYQYGSDSRSIDGPDQPSTSAIQTKQEGQKPEELILPGGIKVFKSKIIYKADTGVTIYEGEKAKVDGVHKIAVKFLPHTKNAMREAQSLEAIRYHRNVVGIYDTGVHSTELGEYIFITMELCSQESLFQYISRNSDFDRQQAISHSTQIISGLEYIHSKKVLHRDLKPQNVLFLDCDSHDQLKITDFGVSKNFLTDPLSTANQTFGNLGYTSPEIIKGEACDDPTKTDIFSLGIILVFILSSGKHPYGDNHWSWTTNIAEGKKPDLSKILFPNGGQRDAICRIILSMLHPNPDDRPSAADVLKAWTKDVLEHYERTEMTAVTKDFLEISASALATFSRYETGHDSASSSQPSEKLTSKVNALEQHLTEFEANTSKSLKEIKQQLVHGACGKQQSEHEALSLGSGKIPDDVIVLSSSLQAFKSQKLHTKKQIYNGEKATAVKPIHVVVKLVRHSKDAFREAQSLYSISHPNVVKIHDSGECLYNSERLIFIAMEQCSEETLFEYVNNHSSIIDPQQAVRHSTQIISGLEHIHEIGNIAHRDIKPQNVLFKANAGYKEIKIVDFGTSKNLDDMYETSQVIGTLGYYAPEIIRREKLDDPQKCDIFSLGILLVFILSNGKHPYGDKPWQQNNNVAEGKDPDFSHIQLPNGKKRDAIICILKKMLQQDPRNRPTAENLVKDWKEKVLDVPDPIVKIEKELKENMLSPLSKAELVEQKECELMGCKVKFEENSFQLKAFAYVGITYIKMKSDHVPNEQWGHPISPEVELKIPTSSCEHRATISVPLHALPEENDFQILQKKDGRTEWELLQVKPALKDRRLAMFEVSFVKSVRVLVTCSRIQTTFLQHSLYFNAGTLELLSVLSIDNEVLSTKLNDTLKTHGFNRYENPVIPKNFSHVFELQGQPLKYKYRYIHPTTGYKKFLTKEIIVESDKFMNDPFCCDFFVLRQQESETSAPFVEMTIFSQQDEKVFYVSIWKEEHVGLTNTGYVSVRRSTSSYFDELPKNDVYQMDASKLKGMCLIVNNEFLEKENARKGSCEDIKMQVALWNDLGFEVTPVINADDMLGKCQQFAALANETCPNIVVVIIMTHGGTDEGKQILQAENGQLISLDQVVSLFKEENSPHLKGIPKLFMSLACRTTISKKIDSNVPSPSLSERIKNVVKPQPLKNQLQPVACDSDSDCGGGSDILIAYPSQNGKEARGHPDTGSRMMRAVTKVFMENSHNTDVHHMFLKVNNAVSEMGFKIIQRSGQNTSMRNQLYLLPGWPAKQ